MSHVDMATRLDNLFKHNGMANSEMEMKMGEWKYGVRVHGSCYSTLEDTKCYY